VNPLQIGFYRFFKPRNKGFNGEIKNLLYRILQEKMDLKGRNKSGRKVPNWQICSEG